jgi:phytoene synthase
LRFEISRARMLYRAADERMRHIPRGRRYPVIVARQLYEAILGRIEAQGYDVFSWRAQTSLSHKLGVAAVCAWGDPKELVARVRGGNLGGIAIPS